MHVAQYPLDIGCRCSFTSKLHAGDCCGLGWVGQLLTGQGLHPPAPSVLCCCATGLHLTPFHAPCPLSQALLQQGSNRGKVIHSDNGALVPKRTTCSSLSIPLQLNFREIQIMLRECLYDRGFFNSGIPHKPMNQASPAPRRPRQWTLGSLRLTLPGSCKCCPGWRGRRACPSPPRQTHLATESEGSHHTV